MVVIVFTLIIITLMPIAAGTFIDGDAAVGCAADARACVRRVATATNDRNRGHLRNEDTVELRVGRH